MIKRSTLRRLRAGLLVLAASLVAALTALALALVLAPAPLLKAAGNVLLRGGDLRIADVGRFSLSPQALTLSSLTLHDGDGRYRLRKLSAQWAPQEAGGTHLRRLSAALVELDPAASEPGTGSAPSPLGLARQLRRLSLPPVHIDRLRWGDVRVLTEIRLANRREQGELAFTRGDRRLTARWDWRGQADMDGSLALRKDGQNPLGLAFQLLPGHETLDFAVEDLQLPDLQLPALRLAGTLTPSAPALAVRLTLEERPLLAVQAHADTSMTAGEASVRLLEQNFTADAPLSERLSLLPDTLDLVAGHVEGEAELAWRWTGDTLGLTGPLSLTLQGISGFYEDLVFTGLDTRVQASLENGTLRSDGELSATLEALDPGLPLTDLSWHYRFASEPPRLSLRDLQGRLLGGGISVDHFDYRPDAEQNHLQLEFSGLQLERVANLVPRPGLMISGAVSGQLPVTLSPEGIRIEAGTLHALPPGGTIRYAPEQTPQTGGRSLQLVYDALSDYRYDSLEAEVSYQPDGELLLAMQLRGHNPLLDDGRPIHLNLNISNNMVDMFRSLQASRNIEEALEQHLENRRPAVP